MVHLVEHQLWLLPEPREPLVPGAAEALRTPGSLLRPSASKEQLLGADVGTLRPHRGCSNTAPLIFPGRQLQPLRSAWLAEAKLLRSDVADLERPFWGSPQTHTHVHTPKHTCPCTHTHTCACTQTCVCTRTYMHTQTHMHTERHMHVCTHTYRCIPGEGRERQTGPGGDSGSRLPPSVTDCAASSRTRQCCRCGRFNYVTGGRRGLSGSPVPGEPRPRGLQRGVENREGSAVLMTAARTPRAARANSIAL